MSAPAFPVVGVGASAGGLAALEGFFHGLPAQPGIAFVLVADLSPEQDLQGVVGRSTGMPVHPAEHGMPIEIDSVYVLPAGATLGIADGRLTVTQFGDRRDPQPIGLVSSALAELQSSNQTLQTANAELGLRIESLDRANRDLQRLFDGTRIATIVLDRLRAIRSFTPAVAAMFDIQPGDRGRPITEVSGCFARPDFIADIDRVLAGSAPVERLVDQQDGAAHYIVGIGPYGDAGQPTGGVAVTFVDVTNLIRSEARQRMLIGELQHRTRNLLAIVLSIAHQTFAKGESLESFGSRLGALGRVQGLISSAQEDAIGLEDVIELELQAHGSGRSGRVSIEGPAVTLDLDRVQTFALALHELATNAVKYGALKAPDGRLAVRWQVGDEGMVHLHWQESGVEMPAEPVRRGDGSKLIEKTLAYTLRAKTELVFSPGGVSCRIAMPIRPPAPAAVSTPIADLLARSGGSCS